MKKLSVVFKEEFKIIKKLDYRLRVNKIINDYADSLLVKYFSKINSIVEKKLENDLLGRDKNKDEYNKKTLNRFIMLQKIIPSLQSLANKSIETYCQLSVLDSLENRNELIEISEKSLDFVRKNNHLIKDSEVENIEESISLLIKSIKALKVKDVTETHLFVDQFLANVINSISLLFENLELSYDRES